MASLFMARHAAGGFGDVDKSEQIIVISVNDTGDNFSPMWQKIYRW
jgi:hypothetical protein